MSDSVRPQRWQPTGLFCPWDSPGKNTGVGCHFPLQCMKVKRESEVAQSCPALSDPLDCSLPGASVHGILQAGVLEWAAIAFSVSWLQSPDFSALWLLPEAWRCFSPSFSHVHPILFSFLNICLLLVSASSLQLFCCHLRELSNIGDLKPSV